MAIRAEKISDNVFNDENLLQDGRGENFLLDGEFDLDSLGMRLSPYKVGIDKLHLVHLTNATQAVAEKLLTFKCDGQPTARRLMITATTFAPLDCDLFGDSLCDVNLAADAIHAHVGCIWRRNHSTAKTAGYCSRRMASKLEVAHVFLVPKER